jgi:5-bromo-4-chloroindolyl phosphate hydrolysis protein
MATSPDFWTPAMVAVVGSVFVALLGALTSMIMTLAGLRKKAEETGDKTDKLVEKTAEIHALTNSGLSAIKQELAVAQEKIIGLEKAASTKTASKAKK